MGDLLDFINENPLLKLLFFRGRVALYTILKALGANEDYEVATQAFTCLAVPEAIMATGAKPIYVDLEKNGVNMSADDLEQKINIHTKAIIVQHTYGIPACMDRLLYIARKFNVTVIEDCCHTFDSTFQNQTVGTFGSASFYSFEWGKPVILGIGGAAIINDPVLEEKVRGIYNNLPEPEQIRVWRLKLQYTIFNILYRPKFYWPVRSLFHFFSRYGLAEGNYNVINADQLPDDFSLRMSSYHRNMLEQKLRQYPETLRRRKEITALYKSNISSSDMKHIPVPDNVEVVYARYPLVTKNKSTLLDKARKQGIEVSNWYATPVHPLNEQEWEKAGYQKGACPNAEQLCTQIITLPVNEKVSDFYVRRTLDFFNHY